jgi:ABC-type antimicrobial peptide transport system permease subunit
VGGVLGIVIRRPGGLARGLVSPSVPRVLQPAWIVIAFVTSVVVGLSFGLWPAWKAARLDPIEALRYE